MENNKNTDILFYIQSALLKVKRYWYFFLLSIIGFPCLALFANWYMQPVYEVGSLILIDEKANEADASEEFMKSFSIFSTASDIHKEMQKMKSLELIYEALKKTEAEVTYYTTTSGIKKIELYDDSPFHIKIIKDHIQPLGVKFKLTSKSENTFNLEVDNTKSSVDFYNYKKDKMTSAGSFSINQDYNYGDTIKSDFFCFIVLVNNEQLQNFEPGLKYSFVFNNLHDIKYQYQKELKVEQIGRDIQALTVKMKVKNVQKGIDFINALTRVYMQRNVDKKNFLAEKSIQYIDSQLGIIQDSLKLNESDLQTFRSNNKMMEIKSLSDQAFKGASDLETQKSELESRASYYKYIYNNLENDQNNSNLLVPSSMGVNDQVLTGIIEQYIKLSTERNNLISNKKTLSPYFNMLTSKVNVQKNTLLETIQSHMTTNNLLLSSINEQLRRENAKIRELPGTERKLVEIERKQNLHDDIFKYMLRKKAEAQVAKGSNLPDNDILEPAKLMKRDPVSPNKVVNFLASVFIGLVFPFVVFGIKGLLNDTVINEEMLLSLVQLPIIGRVYRKKDTKQTTILNDSPKSPILESIRTVRTNIEFFLEGKKNQVILFSSSISGEGKSFCSLNLANSLALANRKTVLVDFDLRKPNEYFPFKSEDKSGVASFLKEKSTLKDIFIPTGIPNLDFIGAGETPSNPAELIDSEKTKILIESLKKEYDYVIIDTAPVGLVWETFVLMQYADLKIFVVRENVTPKKGVVAIVNELQVKKIDNLYFLINDVDTAYSIYGKQNAYFTKE